MTIAIRSRATDLGFEVAGQELATLRSTGLQVPTPQALTDAAQLSQIVGRNKIIGGDFSTNPWQRGTSFTAPASGSYTADRFKVVHSSDAVVDILKTADAPTAAQSGVFTQHCLHVDVTTADASITAGQYYVIEHDVEGLNAKGFGFGQAGTRYVTRWFFHKHTKTGTHCVAVINSANNRSYVAEYTQSVSDEWELSSVTIPVDTSGTWLYDTGIGLRLIFVVAAGSTYQTAANAWSNGQFYATANQVNNLDSIANNFKIALVQLEAGQVPTRFEDLDVGTVVLGCYRYRHPFAASGTNFDGATTYSCSTILSPPVRDMVSASITLSAVYITNVGYGSTPVLGNTTDSSNNGLRVQFTSTASVVGYHANLTGVITNEL